MDLVYEETEAQLEYCNQCLTTLRFLQIVLFIEGK